MKKIIILLSFIILGLGKSFAQPESKMYILDEVLAIVGDNYILRTDLEKEVETIKAQYSVDITDSLRLAILNQIIEDKILLFKAQLDSIAIEDERVEQEIDRKISYILQVQFRGDEAAFEKYLGKSILQFKNESKQKMREKMLTEEMRNKILRDVRITPNEVRRFYNRMSKDSLPEIPAEVEISQIIKVPKVSAFAKQYAYDKINGLRERILSGEDEFSELAFIYSEDPGSSGKGGETGYFTRGKMVPEFEEAAFRLKPGDTVSKIIETTYGYHILQLIDRKGENINVRHILIRPQIISDDVQKAKDFLDSIKKEIEAEKITFENAAKKHSDDENSKNNGGLLTDPNTGSTKIPVDFLDPDNLLLIDKMEVGEIAGPLMLRLETSNAYKLVYLKSKSVPHTANLKDDYQRIMNMALAEKKTETIEKWLKENKSKFYIKIDEKYADHPALKTWRD